MQVFKAYFKVIRKLLPQMSITLLVFLFIAVSMTLFPKDPLPSVFKPSRPKVAILSADQADPFSAGLVSWLDQRYLRVDVPDQEDQINDALFHETVTYVLRIPEGFGRHFLAGDRTVRLGEMMAPQEADAIQARQLVNRYLDQAAVYRAADPGIEPAELSRIVSADLSSETEIRLLDSRVLGSENRSVLYFQFLAYTLISVMITGITAITRIFYTTDLNRRTLASPLSPLRFSMQLLAGNVVFTLAVWALMVAFSIVLGGAALSASALLLMAANALVFAFTCLTLSLFIGQFLRKESTQSMAANVLALAFGFVSGVFVPQALLGETVLQIARFTPSYWYVRALGDIAQISEFTPDALKPVGIGVLIQIGFALAFLVLSLAVGQQRRVSNA